ncbi:MAG TPA: CPBP family intramembrane metalloprotease [Chitinophagaceae bacterium]|nr:CPBP family intramembrane metalloprotease [Chitinophagaceae bacterium]
MLNRYLTTYSPAMQFVVFCAILSMCWFTGGTFGEMWSVKFTGLKAEQISTMSSIPHSLSETLKWMNGILLIILLLIPALLFAYLAYPYPLEYLGFRRVSNPSYYVLAFLLLCMALPFSSVIEQGCRDLPFFQKFHENDEQYNRMASSMLFADTVPALLKNLLAVCLLPALIEEIFFRGCLQQLLLHWMKKYTWLVLILVAAIFSAFHGQMSGFLPRLYLGLILGIVYYLSGSIWLSIGLHFLNNAISVVLAWLFHSHILKGSMETLPDVPLWIGIPAGLLSVLVIVVWYRKRIPFPVYQWIDEPENSNE